jgi:hypothetical protein
VRCETHEVDGPQLARTAGGMLFTGAAEDRGTPRADGDAAMAHWAEFLIEHEYCELRLAHERRERLAAS